MKKLSAALLVVVLALVVMLSFTLRELSRVETHLAALEAKSAEPFHVGLGEVMGYQQRWIDKLGLAAQAGNWSAAAFYASELKETADDIVAARITREGQNVSELVRSALLPAIDGVADAVQRRNRGLFATHYGNLLGACNTCHAESKVPFIHITASDDTSGRWNQIFAPATVEK